MKKIEVGRRSFLKISGMVGGGLAFGFHMSACSHETGQIEEDVLGLAPNAFIKIFTNGNVIIMSPNPEIGQGVKTSMPMIVAEELDVSWDQVTVEQAPLDTENYTRQLAGGSQSIRQGWSSLRMAGATVRRVLLEAAAREWQVGVDELSTAEGIIYHQASDRSISYGEISTKAGDIEMPEEVELKEPKDFTIIGTGKKNVDSPKIVTGEPLFGLDYKADGMLIAMIEHPPAFGMKIKSFDATEAKAMPGITDVITINTRPEGSEQQWSDINAFPELLAVVGSNTWSVWKAKKALKVEWEWDSEPENTDQHKVELEKLVGQSLAEADRQDGDPESVFSNADQILERTFTAPFLAHNTMEPMNFFAHVTAEKAELVGPIQTPEYLRKTVSQLIDLPEEKISIMMTRMGGGFGRRLYGNFGNEVALISKQMNAPIKLVYTREDDMTQGTYRPDYRVTYKAAIKDNKLMALTVKGAGTDGGPVFHSRYPAGTIDHYAAKNFRLESNISTGAWRAPRSNFMACAENSFLDEIAEAVGKDPVDFRMDLFDRAINDPVGEKNDYDPERYAGVLQLVKEKAGWGTDKPGVHRGISAYYCHNSYVAQVVDIVMEGEKPVIEKVWCAVDCGIVINTEGALNQIEGGIIDGIGHAMYSGLSFTEGKPDQQNFDKYKLIRHMDAPKAIETFFVKSEIPPTGLGEPTLPPIQGALANALYKATGKRMYNQPFEVELEKPVDISVG